MISCVEFIPAYSQVFKFIEEKSGKKEVIEFWKYLACEFLEDSLKKNVMDEGLRGCYTYWSKTLNEEDCDFKMELDEEKKVFTINMKKCPSKGMLLRLKHIEPYKDYCEHCDWLYRTILEPLSYEYELDMTNCNKAECVIKVSEKEK